MNIVMMMHQIEKGGGMVSQAINMANSYIKQNHKVQIYTSQRNSTTYSKSLFLNSEVRIYNPISRISYYPPFFYSQIYSLFQKNSSDCDVIQCFNPFFDAIPAIKIKQKKGLPVIIRFGTIYENFYTDKYLSNLNEIRSFPSDAIRNIGKAIVSEVSKLVDVIIFNSSFLANEYFYIENPNVTVIRNGLDLDLFSPKNEAAPILSHLNGIKNKRIILYVGRIEPRKSIQTLIKAYSELALSLRKETHLLIIGSTKTAEKYCIYLKKLSEKLGIKSNITFIGSIKYEDLPDYYSAAEFLVFTSDYSANRTSEGLPNVILESMACGTVCIAARIAGVEEVIREGYNGYLYSPNQSLELAKKMELALNNPQRLKLLARRARRSIEKKHDINNVSSQYIKIYERMIGK